MAKKVMQRVAEMIAEQEPDLRAFLTEVLRIENAAQANKADSGAKEKIHHRLVEMVKRPPKS